MTDNVTGYGVPLTTAQRVAKYGPRTRAHLTGGLPPVEVDGNLDANYRETVLIGYEDIDHRAAKVLSDIRSWQWFRILGLIIVVGAGVLFAFGIFATSVALTWMVPAVIAVVASFIYRRIERRKHTGILEEARESIAKLVESGKVRYL